MPDVAEQPSKPPRTWRPMAGWTLGILLALGLTWFIAAVAVPAYRAISLVERYRAEEANLREAEKTAAITAIPPAIVEIESCGGPRVAVRLLNTYFGLPERLAPHRVDAAQLLSSCGSDAIPLLITLASDKDQRVRLWAVDGLAENPDVRAVDTLLLVATWGDTEEAHAADIALARIPDPRVVEHFTKLLKDENQHVRAFAASRLGLLGADAVPVLTEALLDRSARVRHDVAKALGRMGADAQLAVPALERVLVDPNEPVRQAAAEALRKIKGVEAGKFARDTAEAPEGGHEKSRAGTGVIEIEEDNFRKIILEHKGVAVVDFFATWCGPSKSFAPIFTEFAAEVPEGVVVGKADVDRCPQAATQQGIMSVPTVVFFRDGKEVDRLVGVQRNATLTDRLKVLNEPPKSVPPESKP